MRFAPLNKGYGATLAPLVLDRIIVGVSGGDFGIRGYLRALDPRTGKKRWEYPMTGPATMWAGTLSTAGGLIFFGDDDGQLVALNAQTGEHLWHFSLGQRISASPVTFEVDGKQYVTIASATHVFTFGLFEAAQSVAILPGLR